MGSSWNAYSGKKKNSDMAIQTILLKIKTEKCSFNRRVYLKQWLEMKWKKKKNRLLRASPTVFENDKESCLLSFPRADSLLTLPGGLVEQSAGPHPRDAHSDVKVGIWLC